MILKLGMYHRGIKLYKVYIKLTLTFSTTRSNLTVYAFKWEKTIIKSETAWPMKANFNVDFPEGQYF